MKFCLSGVTSLTREKEPFRNGDDIAEQRMELGQGQEFCETQENVVSVLNVLV